MHVHVTANQSRVLLVIRECRASEVITGAAVASVQGTLDPANKGILNYRRVSDPLGGVFLPGRICNFKLPHHFCFS